jgi:hypothetical protein
MWMTVWFNSIEHLIEECVVATSVDATLMINKCSAAKGKAKGFQANIKPRSRRPNKPITVAARREQHKCTPCSASSRIVGGQPPPVSPTSVQSTQSSRGSRAWIKSRLTEGQRVVTHRGEYCEHETSRPQGDVDILRS